MHQVLEKLELVRPFFPVAMNQAVYYVNQSMSLFHRVMPIVYKSSTYLHFWNLRISPKKFKLSHW